MGNFNNITKQHVTTLVKRKILASAQGCSRLIYRRWQKMQQTRGLRNIRECVDERPDRLCLPSPVQDSAGHQRTRYPLRIRLGTIKSDACARKHDQVGGK